MLRLLFAALAALASLASMPFTGAFGALGAFTLFSWVFGGAAAASAPALPLPNLAVALPDADRLVQARDLERGKAKAADHILKQSPELQVKIYASMSEDDRLTADLTLLSPDQVDWLMNLSDAQLKAVAATSDRRVAAALAGEHNAITAVKSVNQLEPIEEQSVLARRMAAFRGSAFTVAPPSHALN